MRRNLRGAATAIRFGVGGAAGSAPFYVEYLTPDSNQTPYPLSAVVEPAAWNVRIVSDKPNAPVTITQNGLTYPIGTTQADGNWYMGSGVGPAVVGSWAISFAVAGETVGAYSVNILPRPANSVWGNATPTTPAPAAATTYSPTLSFRNLTTGNAASFAPGDQWSLAISGAAPNAAVTVYGGRNGANVSAAMGQTNTSGAWSLGGSYVAGDAGSWFERWYVGGVQVGPDLSFGVLASTPTPTTPLTPIAISDGPLASNQVVSALPASVQPAAQQIVDAASAIPLWVWGAAGIAAAWAFGGKRSR